MKIRLIAFQIPGLISKITTHYFEDVHDNLWAAQLADEIEKWQRHIRAVQKKLLDQYQEEIMEPSKDPKDKDLLGLPKMIGSGRKEIPKKNENKFNEEWEKLMEKEVEVKINPLPLSKLASIRLTGLELSILRPLYYDDTPVAQVGKDKIN